MAENTLPREDITLETREPRYLVLAKELIRGIRSGTYPVGTLLPPESELCVAFGVSRSTVREAIRKLSDIGLVSRHHGVGTRVEAAETQPRYSFSIGGLQDFLNYVSKTRLRVVRRERVQAKLAGVELPEIGSEWLMHEGFRYQDEERDPICWTRIYLHPRYSKVAEQSGHTSEPLFVRIQNEYGERISELQQELSAVLLTAEIATALNAEVSSPALSTLRRYIGSDGNTVAVTVTIHPADRFRYNQVLRVEYSPTNRR